jgi:D-aspartate ligase
VTLRQSNESGIDVLLLGGQENALSIARSLGLHGVTVRISAPEPCYASSSRFCASFDPVPPGREPADHWHALLLEQIDGRLAGSLILALSDDAVGFVARFATELARQYVVAEQRPDLQLDLLDKEQTLELAKRAGCAVPWHRRVRAIEDVERLGPTLEYPVAVKPIHSHVFRRAYKGRLFVADDAAHLVRLARPPLEQDLDIMITEYVPGPDSLLNSYYTYLDANGQPLFHYTKRIVRRGPNFGGGTCHVSQWLPETAEAGLRFFQGIGFRGFGNIEFKRDPRDGVLKVIECNPRFTAAQELLVRCGIDASSLIYAIANGYPPQQLRVRGGSRWLWAPWGDLHAVHLLRRRGAASLSDWLRVVPHRLVFPYFSLQDPRPALRKAADDWRWRVERWRG